MQVQAATSTELDTLKAQVTQLTEEKDKMKEQDAKRLVTMRALAQKRRDLENKVKEMEEKGKSTEDTQKSGEEKLKATEEQLKTVETQLADEKRVSGKGSGWQWWWGCSGCQACT